MKKILMAFFAALALAAWVVPAMAVDTQFDGQYRVRTIYVNNLADTNNDATDNNSWIDQRFRLGVMISETPVMGYVQLQMGDYKATGETAGGFNDSHVWGTGGGENFDVQVRQAYLDFPVGPVGIRLGRTYASHGFLGGGMFENIADRYIFTYKVSDELTTSFIHAKAAETSGLGAVSTTGNDNDKNIYNLGGTYNMGDQGDAAARIYYVRDGGTAISQSGGSATGTWSATWLTAQANLKFDPVNVYISGAYLTGESNVAATTYDLTGYAVHGDVNASFGPAKVGLVAGMGSGDDNTTDNKLGTFFAPGGASYIQSVLFFQSGENNYSIGSIGGALNTQNGSRETLSNVTWAGLYGDFKATDDLTLSAKAAMFLQTAALTTNDNTDIGSEYDLIANYKLHKGLTLLAAAAFFMPGDAYTGGGTAPADTISAYYARLQYDF